MKKENSLIYEMLRTPQQVQQEQLEKIRERSLKTMQARQANLSQDPIIGALQSGFADAGARAARILPEQRAAYGKAVGGLLSAASGLGVDPNNVTEQDRKRMSMLQNIGRDIERSQLTPEAQEAAKTQDLIKGIDTTSALGLKAAADKLEAVRPDVATQLRERAALMEAAANKAAQDQENKDRELEIEAQKAGAAETTANAAMISALAKRLEAMGKKNLPKNATPFQEAEAKALSKEYGETTKSATSAVNILDTISQAEGLLTEGMFTGSGADLKVKGAKFLTALGRPTAEGEVANNEAFAGIMGDIVLSQLSQLGANPTEGERKYILEISGEAGQSEKGLRALLDFQRRKVMSQFSKQHTTIDNVVMRQFGGDYKKAAAQGYTKIAPPSYYAEKNAETGDVKFYPPGSVATKNGVTLVWDGKAWKQQGV